MRERPPRAGSGRAGRGAAKGSASVRRFPAKVVEAIREGKVLGVRAGDASHRMIGIWAVVVDGRVFVRSWSVQPDGWYRALRREPYGAIGVGGRELPARARFPRGERLMDAVSRAYLEKYRTPGSIRYARDMGRAKSRATTTELVPAASRAAKGPRTRGG